MLGSRPTASRVWINCWATSAWKSPAALENNTIGGNSFGGHGNLISGNGGDGVWLTGVGTLNNLVQGNLIGTDSTGTIAVPNASYGIAIDQASSKNTIGGNLQGLGNVISGNLGIGVFINDPPIFATSAVTSLNVVQGNFIGTDGTGLHAVLGVNPSTGDPYSGNQGGGVFIGDGATQNLIGTDGNGVLDFQERNVISANSGTGVFIRNADGNTVAGNLIGTDVTSQNALGNGGDGVLIEGGNFNAIGVGQTLAQPDGSFNLLFNNADSANVISGNDGDNVVIDGAGTTNNWVAGNRIGVDASGLISLPGPSTNEFGIAIGDGAAHNLVGAAVGDLHFSAERNVIANATSAAVSIFQADFNTIAGNYINTDASGNVAMPSPIGISILGNSNTIGGSDFTAPNVIGNGINIISGSNNWIAQNLIGTTSTGNALLAGGGSDFGVEIVGIAPSSGNVIGSRNGGANEGNVIAGALSGGVLIQGANSSSNVVAGNIIGLGIDGSTVLGNGSAPSSGPVISGGVIVRFEAHDNTIGGTLANERNIISGNLGEGILIAGGGAGPAVNTLIEGNYIGTDKTGSLNRGNSVAGIEIDSGSQTVGGSADGASNIIAFNGFNNVANGQQFNGAGVWLLNASAATSIVSRNSIFGNDGIGIDIGFLSNLPFGNGTAFLPPDGSTANVNDNPFNAPVITSIQSGVGVVVVEGYSRPGQTIEFYLSDGSLASFGQGKVYLATAHRRLAGRHRHRHR